MANKKKDEKPKTLKVGGTGHTVKKNKKGDVIVDHAGNQGKWDKINLTKKGGSKTIKQGVKAVKSWHKNNPHKGQEK
jgi:NAD/NADP transhydrogenase alpha subunit